MEVEYRRHETNKEILLESYFILVTTAGRLLGLLAGKPPPPRGGGRSIDVSLVRVSVRDICLIDRPEEYYRVRSV